MSYEINEDMARLAHEMRSDREVCARLCHC